MSTSASGMFFGFAPFLASSAKPPLPYLGMMVIFAAFVAVGCLLPALITQISMRVVTSRTPTFGAAYWSLFLGGLVTIILGWVVGENVAASGPAGLFGWLACTVLLQSFFYARYLKDDHGNPPSYPQSVLITILFIPVAVGVILACVCLFAIGGMSMASLTALPSLVRDKVSSGQFWQQEAPAVATTTRAPASMRLTAPVAVQTAYGTITHRVGTEVTVIETRADGIRGRIGTTEVLLRREQLAP